MSMRIRIDVQGTRRYLTAEKQFWERAGDEAMEFFKTKGVEILQKHTPIGKTRQLHDLCTAEVSGKTVKIFSTAPHAEHVDGEGKTEESPGRYVPAIDKRLVTRRITPKQAIMKRAARKKIPGRLPKGLKIKFLNKESFFTLEHPRPLAGLYDPSKRKIFVAAKNPPRSVERTLTHELWHAVQHAEGLPYSEREAESVEKSLEQRIGMHPGSKKTPFGRTAAEELRSEGEEWIRQKVRERK